jgi:glyoxylate/hydroxypyruvate reductase A
MPAAVHSNNQSKLFMKISLCYSEPDRDQWMRDLSKALPDALISLWEPGAPEVDYAIVRAPNELFFLEQPHLKAIFNIGAGVDSVLKLDLPPKIPLIRLNDAGMAVQMVDYVCHSVLRHFREFDNYDEKSEQKVWAPRPTRDRAEFPVGVMGLGALGERVARALTFFDFPVFGWSRTKKSVLGVDCFSGHQQLSKFLKETRILVCLLPLTPRTEGIINSDNLMKLKAQGYVINVARGAHLVEEDLLKNIDSGHIAGATLDVFRQEPLPPEHPFWTHPKINVTPHVSAHIDRASSVFQIVAKIKAFERGHSVQGLVHSNRGY